jgi:hypothetical protein
MMAVAPEETASATPNSSPTETPSPSNGNAESKEGDLVNYDAPSAEETIEAPLTPSKKATKYQRMKKVFTKKKSKRKRRKDGSAKRGKKMDFWDQEESNPEPPSGSESAAEKLQKDSKRKLRHFELKKKKKEKSERLLKASSEAVSSASAGDQVDVFIEQVEEVVDSLSTRQEDLSKSDSGSPGKDKEAKTSKKEGLKRRKSAKRKKALSDNIEQASSSDAPPQLQESAELGDEQEMEEMEAGIRNNTEAVAVEESESKRLKDASLGPSRREKKQGMPGWIFISLTVGLVFGTALGATLAVMLSG